MNEVLTVDSSGKITAKELYEFLGLSNGEYSRWCKRNIEDNQFAELEVDYFPFGVNTERGAQATIGYNLTIDFAKKLCMISKSPKGEQARNYFIEVEKKFNKPMCMEDMMIAQLQNMKEVRLRIEQNTESIKVLEAKITNIPVDYFTIAGYASLRGIKVDVSKANLLGRKGATMSRKNGYDIGKVSDSKFGQVNTYHLDILKQLFC